MAKVGAMGIIWAEASWAWHRAGRAVLRLLRRNTAPAALLHEVNLLLRLVRTTPWWARGHVLVGLKELELSDSRGERISPKSLATMRLGAEAALRLLGEEERIRTSCGAQAWLLLGKVALASRRFEPARERLEAVLDSAEALLSQRMHFIALEDAAAAAMVLGEEEHAAQYLRKIPEPMRRESVRVALASLTAPSKIGEINKG